MRLTITIETIKDSTRKAKQAMFVTYTDKKGKKTTGASEVPKDCPLAHEIEYIIEQMEDLAKAQKLKIKKAK